MAADLQSREQRLRKQAELQSLHLNLASLREREASYIAVSAAIPELLAHQINEQRQQISRVEDELLALGDETLDTTARQAYRDAFAAEIAEKFETALKLYKQAARGAHPDAEAAVRSVRYKMRQAKAKPASSPSAWSSRSGQQLRGRFSPWLAAVILIALAAIVAAVANSWSQSARQTGGETPPATVTPTPAQVILITPPTATPTPSPTPIPTPSETPTPRPTPTTEPDTPTPSPTPSPTLRPPPQILEPKDGLVWYDGAIVFEFKEMNLAYDELYCLNTMRGFDQTLTENWSYPPTGSKRPSIPIEANVFRVARQQGMQCVVWSAAIGKGSCENIISESTEERVIGLPRPCNFK